MILFQQIYAPAAKSSYDVANSATKFCQMQHTFAATCMIYFNKAMLFFNKQDISLVAFIYFLKIKPRNDNNIYSA